MSYSHPNRFLSALSDNDFKTVCAHLKTQQLNRGAVLFSTGERVARIYFPHGGIVTLVVELSGGEMIEAAMIGRDSVVGLISGFCSQIALNKAIVQIPCKVSSIDVAQFRKVANQSATLRAALMRHLKALFAQAQQSVACNLAHSVEARLARWLLRSRDLSGHNEMELTQEFMSQMLGVHRMSVSFVAGALQNARFIKYRRGHIRIIDPDGLRDVACECYGVVKQVYDQLLNNTPFDSRPDRDIGIQSDP